MPRDYIERYKGAFDKGWDVLREEYLKRQKSLGIVPQDAELTERNRFVKPWEELSDKEKLLFAHYMEVYAGFLEHTDEQIGRVISYLEKQEILDDTLIVLLSDNGASAEGGQDGTFVCERGMQLYSEPDDMEFAYSHMEEMGSEYSSQHYPIGWANLGNTPFSWYKSWVHAGGIRDPLIIRYPAGIPAPGGIRTQYCHVGDITPTVLDILGIEKGESVFGRKQKPMHGTSLAYTFDNENAPTRKTIQYYEQTGNRAIWKEGWKAVANHLLVDDYADDVWELYDTENDFSEKNDLAGIYPEKLEELKQDWEKEAQKYGVYPLGYGAYVLRSEKQKEADKKRRILAMKEEEFHFSHIVFPYRTGRQLALDGRNLTTEIEIDHSPDNEGTLYALGTRFGGYTLYIKGNRLCYTYNSHIMEYFRIASDPLPADRLVLRCEIHVLDENREKAVLFVNKKHAGETIITRLIHRGEINFSIKDGYLTSVDPGNELPFEYPGEIIRMDVKVASYSISEEELLTEFFHND